MMTTLVILACVAILMTFAYIEKVIQLDRCQADSSMKLDELLDRCQADSSMKLGELNAQYHVLYDNVERTHGYCAARQMARQHGEREAQLYKLDSTSSPKAAKSIEVF